jgi:F0F1-type ATP synthase membrane subunit a
MSGNFSFTFIYQIICKSEKHADQLIGQQLSACAEIRINFVMSTIENAIQKNNPDYTQYNFG